MMEQVARRTAGNTTESTSGVTVEHLLFGAVVAIAIGMRFVGLGLQPLTAAEAGHTWAAWQAATAAPVAGAPGSTNALLYGIDAALFFLFGGNDLLARFVPALAGVALVFLPWLWRAQIGRVAALVVALLFAVDPWLVAISRQAGGGALAIFVALLALSAIWQWQQTGARGWQRTLAVSTGLLFAAGALAWSFLPVLALAFWLAWRAVDADRRGFERSTPFWFLGGLIVGMTGLLMRPEAVAAVAASLTAWVCQIGGCGMTQQPWWWALARLWIDQPLLAVFGVLGVVLLWAPRAQRDLAIFVTAWALWGIALSLLPGKGPEALVMVGLPLALAAGVLLARLLEMPGGEVSGLEVAVLLTVETVLVISGAIWLTSLVDSAAYSQQLLLTGAILLALALVIWVVFGFWAGWRSAVKIAGLFFAVLLLLTTVRSSWQLNHMAGPMQPDGFWPGATNPAVRLLADDVERISSLRRGDPHEMMVQVITPTGPDPVLGWYLRTMRDVRWLLAPQPVAAPSTLPPPGIAPEALAPLVITPQDGRAWAEDPALAGYLGSAYGLRWRWDMTMLPALPPVEAGQGGLDAQQLADLRDQQAWPQQTRPRLEWLFYRKVSTLPPMDSVDLWARQVE